MVAGLIAGVMLAAVPLDAPQLSKKEALARYGAAVWQARRDRLLSAAKSLEAAAKLDPDSVAPLRELVRVYSQIGREPDAIRAARRVLEKTPQDVDTAHTLAKLLHDIGETKEAAMVAKLAADSPVLADRPDKALAVHRDLATLLGATSDFAGAEESLRQALTLLTENRKALLRPGPFTATEADSETASLHERLGKVLVKQAKYDAAVESYRAAHKLYADPKKANDRHAAARLDWNLSGVFAAKGEPASALPHLEAFLKLQPQSLEPYERLAAVLRDAGRGADVVGTLEKYAAADLKNLSLSAVLASELTRDGDTRPRADALFTRIFDETNDAKIVRFVMKSHIESGRASKIVETIDAGYTAMKGDDAAGAAKRQFAADKVRAIADVLRAEPKWAEAVLRAAHDDLRSGTKREHRTWHVMGVLAAHHKKPELAALQYRQAIVQIRQTQPNGQRENESEAYSGLISVLLRSRKHVEVASVCEEGLRIGSHPVLFHYYLAQARAELGEAQLAIDAADKAITQAAAADQLLVQSHKAYILTVLGKWGDAIALHRKLLDEFESPADQARIRYSLAQALWGAKKYPEAEAELRRILDADPDHAGACNDLGYHLADQGRNLAEAERLVRHAIAVDRIDRRKAGSAEPDSAAYLDSLGWVLFRKGNLTGAKEQLEKAAALSDGATDPTVWDHLGDVYFRLDDKAKAKTAWTTAATLYATDARSKREGRLDAVTRKLKQVK